MLLLLSVLVALLPHYVYRDVKAQVISELEPCVKRRKGRYLKVLSQK